MALPHKVVEAFTSKIWLFSHNFDRSTKIMMLDSSGKILGYNGANEFLWEEHGGALFFLGSSGQKSIRFDKASRRLGLLVLEGVFLDPNLAGAEALLEEAFNVEHLTSVSASCLAERHVSVDASVDVVYRASRFGDASADGTGYTAPGYQLATIKNASVISRFGATRAGSSLVSETTFQHPFFFTHNLVEDRHSGYLYAPVGNTIAVDRALLVCGGIYNNYYHWLMFLAAKMRTEFLSGIDTVITSEPTLEFQRSGLAALLQKHGLRAISLKDNASVHVDELRIAYQPNSAGLQPHPAVMEPINILKAACLDEHYRSAEKIYITRSDTTERKLENEKELECLLKKEGFSIVSLTGRTLSEQVNLLHRARLIISPHGAGLTNIVFCQPKAKVLEFQNPAHINWCMKRLATISDLDYGYIMGEVTDENQKSYHIDPAILRKALLKMAG